MMTFRRTKKEDLERIDIINKEKFIFTPGELSIIDGVVTDKEDGIIAFGIVKPMAEATFITDMSYSQKDRVTAMTKMMDIALLSSKEFGVRQLHTFVSDPRLAKALQKHFGFELCNDIVLVKNL